MHRDAYFNEPIVKQFEFDASIAAVFDDMVNRSVPHYKMVQALIVELSRKLLKQGDRVYDLGCSTASTLFALEQALPFDLELFGVDTSAAMIEQAQKKSQAFNSHIKLLLEDILEVVIEDADLIISNYTIQFLRPKKRDEMIKKIYESLNDEGVFIFSEKVIMEDKRLDKAFIEIYYDYKKAQGYSEFEIAQKREALENVLVPYTFEENKEMLEDAGFKSVDTLFRWVNFTTYIAKK